MTIVFQVLAYPGVWPLRDIWAAVLLFLMAKGPAWLSLDHLITRTR